MKFKRSEVMGLATVFNSLLEIKLEPETAFKIASNSIAANEFAEKVRKSYKPVDGFAEIEKERLAMIMAAGATPDKNGGFTIPSEKAFKIGKDIDSFNKVHHKIIEEQKTYGMKFDEIMKCDVEIEFEKIDLKELTESIEPGKLVLLIKTGIITNGNKP